GGVPFAWLLVAGLITAPVPASLVGDAEAIHRASAMLPFAALLAALGLDCLVTEGRWRTAAFAAVWVAIIGVAIVWHDHIRLAQAMVRAATVPWALLAMALSARHVSIAGRELPRAMCAAAAAIVLAELGFAVIGFGATVAASATAFAIAAWRNASRGGD